jgi:hypothetical protein
MLGRQVLLSSLQQANVLRVHPRLLVHVLLLEACPT